MANLISLTFGVDRKKFEKTGVFDSVIGIDTRLFIDPFLLKGTRIPEFKNSRKVIETYFNKVIRLLVSSRNKGDIAWKEAQRRLTFNELKGISIGYGVSSSDGSAIGPGLALKLTTTAEEIVRLGIRDPEIFELIGLFEEGFGADRLSDMIINILKGNIYRYTHRISKILGIKGLSSFTYENKKYFLPKLSNSKNPILFLPRQLLRDLPVAYDRDSIEHVVAVNRALRDHLNKLIGRNWKNKIKKSELRKLLLSDGKNIRDLIKTYKSSKASSYDFEKDPAGEVIWYRIGQEYALQNPISITPNNPTNFDQLTIIVEKIIEQFQKNIENNGLNEHLYIKEGFRNKPRHERYAQRLFYAVADSYCAANNIDISREPDAGSGPVDFKLSTSYKKRILVEIKLSSNSALLKGYEKQLPAYEKSEGSCKSYIIVLRVTNSEASIKRLLKSHQQNLKLDKGVPEVIIINGLLRPSASHR